MEVQDVIRSDQRVSGTPSLTPALTARHGQTRLNDWPHHVDAAGSAVPALAAAVLGFFVVTLDAVVVNVALPSIRRGLGGGISGLQWVVDGYTLMFAALLLASGSLSDRIGAHRAFGSGIGLFVVASVVCGAAPSLGWLVVAR